MTLIWVIVYFRAMDENTKLNQKEYEIAFLVKEGEAQAGVLGAIKANQGEVYYESSVNQIKLAYPINKQTSAFFGFCEFRASAETVKQISEKLKLEPQVVRFLIVVPPKKAAATHEPKEAAPLQTEPKPAAKMQAAPQILSNEALEQKLEEILK